ncbi:MAG TPA: ABC transporter permease [Chloroflexota bacterium]|nr:ABC transporter permease [Chloroflexota bacterium]
MATAKITQTADLFSDDVLAEESPGAWTLAFRRLSKNKMALVSLGIIILFYLIAILAPLLAPYGDTEVHFDAITAPPAWVAGGTWKYLLGTDGLGRDVLSRLIYGSRISMTIGLIPLVFYLLIGGTVGLISGYAGGFVDTVLMRVVDVFYALPDLLVIITMVTFLRETFLGNLASGMVVLLAALALFSWVGTARLIRGQVLSTKELSFVEAARALGASPRRIILQHILPHVLAPVIVQMAFLVPGAIMAEAVLSFIGIGIRPPTPSWGNMIQDGYPALQTQPAMALAPAACIAVITLAFTFLGDGLRDAMDTRMRT